MLKEVPGKGFVSSLGIAIISELIWSSRRHFAEGFGPWPKPSVADPHPSSHQSVVGCLRYNTWSNAWWMGLTAAPKFSCSENSSTIDLLFFRTPGLPPFYPWNAGITIDIWHLPSCHIWFPRGYQAWMAAFWWPTHRTIEFEPWTAWPIWAGAVGISSGSKNGYNHDIF